MDDQELLELQDPATWADDEGEVRPPVAEPRAVVAVNFTADDFEQVARAARRRGLKTAAYVREAALTLALSQPSRAAVESITKER